jgi:hypothetical protein
MSPSDAGPSSAGRSVRALTELTTNHRDGRRGEVERRHAVVYVAAARPSACIEHVRHPRPPTAHESS